MKPENILLLLINLFDTYKNDNFGLHIPGDDCKFFSDQLKKLIEIYDIKINNSKK